MSLEGEAGATTKHIQFGSQQFIDYFALTYYHEVAERLRERPRAVLNHARRTLARWRQVGAPEAYREWEPILDSYSVEELIALLTEDSERATHLRACSPFTGVLSSKRRLEILAECEGKVS